MPPVLRLPLPVIRATCLVTFVTAAVAAAPRDGATVKKIDRAINEEYVNTKFRAAEATLMSAINDCARQCSPAIVAKAWMYVGVVRGSGKNDQKGARAAFENAFASDPRVTLDDAIATPKTQKTFAAVQSTQPPPPAGGADPGASSGGGLGTLDCTPKVSELQTRRPVPVSCSGGEGAKKAELRYKAGRGSWKTLKMKKKRGAFQATIPCEGLGRPGSLQYFVRMKDAAGDPVATYGKKTAPIEIAVVAETDEEPPAFPDKKPPKRCSRSAARGVESCSSEDDCEEGASCVDGACAVARTCEIDEDCSGGARCRDGKCEKKRAPAGPYSKSWVGLHFAYDLAITGGEEVCSQASQRDEGFACYYPGTEEQYRFHPHPRMGNSISTGLAPATSRLLVSFEQLLGSNTSLGVRGGYAFGGGPPSGKKQEVKFLPFHIEVRASYWFGDSPFSRPGFRPYVGARAGAAQVDAKTAVKVGDCAGTPGGAPSKPGAEFAVDATYYQECRQGVQKGAALELEAYKKLGKGFAGIHAGMMYAIGRDSGVVVDLALQQMFPTSGQVIEPSLGYAVGF
jgi:hypothetical protein